MTILILSLEMDFFGRHHKKRNDWIITMSVTTDIILELPLAVRSAVNPSICVYGGGLHSQCSF